MGDGSRSFRLDRIECRLPRGTVSVIAGIGLDVTPDRSRLPACTLPRLPGVPHGAHRVGRDPELA